AAAAARRRHQRDSADRAWTLEVEIYQWLTFEVIGLAACSIFGIYSGPTYDPTMPQTPHLTSESAACCWIPLFALRSELTRRTELASLPVALVASDDTRRVWQISPLARRAGVKPGMTVSQAIGLCPALKLCEPDPVHYDAQFSRLLAALGQVSPVIEPAELGRAFVGTDGLEGLYGGPASIIEEMQLRIVDCGLRIGNSSVKSAIRNPQSEIRVGWGIGKFVSWV